MMPEICYKHKRRKTFLYMFSFKWVCEQCLEEEENAKEQRIEAELKRIANT